MKEKFIVFKDDAITVEHLRDKFLEDCYGTEDVSISESCFPSGLTFHFRKLDYNIKITYSYNIMKKMTVSMCVYNVWSSIRRELEKYYDEQKKSTNHT